MLSSVIYLGFISIPEFQNPTATFDYFFSFYHYYPHYVHENKIIYKFLIRPCLRELLTVKESPKNVSNRFTHCPQEKQNKTKHPKQNQLNTIQTQNVSVNMLCFSLFVYKPERCKISYALNRSFPGTLLVCTIKTKLSLTSSY